MNPDEQADRNASSGRVDLHRDGPTATVILNRPERRNALNAPMWTSLGAHFHRLAAADDSLRCVVLTGANGCFSPGADIGEFETHRFDAASARDYGAVMDRTYDAIRACPIPVIAAIDGPCTGAGLVLALLADIRIATARSVFGAPVGRLGLAMPYPEFAVLWQNAGPAKTLELLFEARVVSADEAAAIGLVNRVVPDDGLDADLRRSIDRIIAGAPLVHRWHKAFSRRMSAGGDWPVDEIAASYDSFATEDYREGYRAFLEKRRPAFKGR